METTENLRRILLRAAGAMAVAGAGLLLAACDDGDAPVPDNGRRPNADVWLTMDIRNLSAATRADDADGHPDEAGTDAEDYVNPDDMAIYLLDADKRLVYPFGKDDFTVTGNTISLRANSANFDLSGPNVTFSLLVMANLRGTGDGATEPFGFDNLGAPLTELSEIRRSFGYTGLTGSAAWTPSVADGRLIPMSGTATVTLASSQLTGGNTADAPVRLPAIDLQRAMAQIRVVDALESLGISQYTVKSVSMRGVAGRGAYLPALQASSRWLQATEVLEYGTMDVAWYDGETQLPTTKFTYTDTPGLVNSSRPSSTYPAFRCYVPEVDLAVLGNRQSPAAIIVIHDNNANKDYSYIYEFPKSMTTGSGTVIDADFARNHIYQLIITNVTPIETELTLGIKYGICPWNERKIIIPPFE